MSDARTEPLYRSPLTELRTGFEANTGLPSRSFEFPRYDTVNAGMPEVLERDRLTSDQAPTFVMEILHAKQSEQDVALMFTPTPWEPSLMFEITKVTLGTTEADVSIHGGYHLSPVSSSETSIWGTAQFGAGFRTLLDYRDRSIDASRSYVWHSGQAMDALARIMQRHMIALYLNCDRVPYLAMQRQVRQRNGVKLADMSVANFLNFYEYQAFNIVRRAQWTTLVKELREETLRNYQLMGDIIGGVNNGMRSSSLFITNEIKKEAIHDPAGIYALFAGSMEEAGSVVTTTASWKFIGAPGEMFVCISPNRERDFNNNWLENMVMRPQYTAFPDLPVEGKEVEADYKNMNIKVPDFAATANFSTSELYYGIQYTPGVERCLFLHKNFSDRTIRRALFEGWFETNYIREIMSGTKRKTFKSFLTLSDTGSKSGVPNQNGITKQCVKSAGSDCPNWDKAFKASWDKLTGNPDKIKTIVEKMFAKTDEKGITGSLSPIALLLFLAASAKMDSTTVMDGLKKLQWDATKYYEPTGTYLYDICEALYFMELPMPFGMVPWRNRVLREQTILTIDNFAAFRQTSQIDQTVNHDAQTGGTTVNFTVKVKDMLLEERGIVMMRGAYPLKGRHLPYGSKAAWDQEFDMYMEENNSDGNLSGERKKDELNGSGHFVFPVMLCEARDILKNTGIVSSIGYDDPGIVAFLPEREVLASNSSIQRYFTTSDVVAQRLNIPNNFKNRTPHSETYLNVEKDLIRVEPYSTRMRTLKESGDVVMCTEAGPTHDRPWIYMRQLPEVVTLNAQAIADAQILRK